MDELSLKIEELEKKVKQIKRIKRKKTISGEAMQHFNNVLAGIDELNHDVLGYKGTNIYLFSKLNSTNYINY